MKNCTGVLLLFLLLSMGCATSDVAADLDQQVVLGFGRTAIFTGDFRITFTRVVSDSRCPVDVTCIQKGDAVIELTCRREKRSEVVRISTDRQRSQADLLGYRVELLNVGPPAVQTQHKPEKYSATIRVSRPAT